MKLKPILRLENIYLLKGRSTSKRLVYPIDKWRFAQYIFPRMNEISRLSLSLIKYKEKHIQ